jgi:acetyltransferase-like isoleucine patch superfamily enzyme
MLPAFLKKIVARYSQQTAFKLQKKHPQHSFGDGTYAINLEIHGQNDGSKLSVGRYCSIADKVQIFLGAEHNTDWITTYPFSALWPAGQKINGHPRTKGNVIIGNDVWIGKEAMILSGVKINDGAVIAARALVCKDVEPYTVVGGIPATKIRKRFDQRTIDRLLNIKWWLWDKARIQQALPMLLNNNTQAFLKAVESGKI